MRGINGQAYIDIEPYLDMKTFLDCQSEILRGFSEARHLAKEGTWMIPGFSFDQMSYKLNWKPIYKALEEFLNLPDDDPIKKGGIDLYKKFDNFEERNKLTRYIKMAMGAYDPYIYYYLWEEGDWDNRGAPRNLTPESKFFPKTVSWVENLVAQNIFRSIGRVIFFHCEAGGIPFEHKDLDAKNGIDVEYPHRNEFIHVRPNTKKAFYIWDPKNKNKIYLNTRAAWWNDHDWHGGEVIMEPSYSLRIDGQFTDSFRKLLGVNYLDFY